MSSVHVQELRDHYVRPLPTSTKISARSPIVLTERDVQVLVAVHQHGFLTTELVELAFFPPASGARSSASSKAYERLRDLSLWGYLERVELPVARVLGGRRPFLCALGQMGVPCVEERMGTAVLPVQVRRLDRLDHFLVDHDLNAAALWANVRAQPRQRRGCRWLWVGERELRAKRTRVYAPQADYWLPFLPDGYFEVIYPSGGTQCALVEVDMGTLTLRRFARKGQAFETALEDGVFQRHLKRDDFEVLVLSQSRRRLEALRHAAGRVVPNERHEDHYLSAFADALIPTTFATATSWDLDGEAVLGVLHEG
jgi:hypothetical protein